VKVIQHSQFGLKAMWICQKRNCSKQSVKPGKAPSLKQFHTSEIPQIHCLIFSNNKPKKVFIWFETFFFAYSYKVQNALKVGTFDTKNIKNSMTGRE